MKQTALWFLSGLLLSCGTTRPGTTPTEAIVESGSVFARLTHYPDPEGTSWLVTDLSSTTDSVLVWYLPVFSDSSWIRLDPVAEPFSKPRRGQPPAALTWKPANLQVTAFTSAGNKPIQSIASGQYKTGAQRLQWNLPAGSAFSEAVIGFSILPRQMTPPDESYLMNVITRPGNRHGHLTIRLLPGGTLAVTVQAAIAERGPDRQ